MPLIKELCPLLDSDGSDNQVKKIRSFITNEINVLKENVSTRKKNIKEHLYLQMSNFRKDKKHMVLIIFSYFTILVIKIYESFTLANVASSL